MAGTADIPTACDNGRTLRMWLHDERTLELRVDGVRDGAEFRVAGLPPGRHTVLAAGNRSTVTVGGGVTAIHDVTFGCAQRDPSPTSSPSPSTTSLPPLPTPLPTESGTAEPSPTPSETSPSPTSTAGAATSAR